MQTQPGDHGLQREQLVHSSDRVERCRCGWILWRWLESRRRGRPWRPATQVQSHQRWQRIRFGADIRGFRFLEFWFWCLFFSHGFVGSDTRNTTGLGWILIFTRGAPSGPRKMQPTKSPSTNPKYISLIALNPHSLSLSPRPHLHGRTQTAGAWLRAI